MPTETIPEVFYSDHEFAPGEGAQWPVRGGDGEEYRIRVLVIPVDKSGRDNFRAEHVSLRFTVRVLNSLDRQLPEYHGSFTDPRATGLFAEAVRDSLVKL